MYSINYTHQFKKDMRKCAKRGLDIEEIKTAIKILSETGALPAEYKPHLLKGDIQKKELSLQREELTQTREELKGQKEQLEEQNKTLNDACIDEEMVSQFYYETHGMQGTGPWHANGRCKRIGLFCYPNGI